MRALPSSLWPGLSAVLREASSVRARSEAGARVVPAVFACPAERGIAVVSATVSRPSLDDVYLRYAGGSFASTDALEAVAS